MSMDKPDLNDLSKMRKTYDNILEYIFLLENECQSTDNPRTIELAKSIGNDMLRYEYSAEFLLGSRILREYIVNKGLQSYTREILDGLGISCEGSYPNDLAARYKSEWRDFDHMYREHVINFGLEYIDRWEMYHNLFEDGGLNEHG